eukprot:scaffold119699_cov32-Tisochrysis_lutea.AAC.4
MRDVDNSSKDNADRRLGMPNSAWKGWRTSRPTKKRSRRSAGKHLRAQRASERSSCDSWASLSIRRMRTSRNIRIGERKALGKKKRNSPSQKGMMAARSTSTSGWRAQRSRAWKGVAGNEGVRRE